MEENDESKPTPVAATPKQAGEARDRWGWVERSVWTERMLTRLTVGESVNRVWFTLVDKTYADRKSTRLNSSHLGISYAVFCLKKTIDARSLFGSPNRDFLLLNQVRAAL